MKVKILILLLISYFYSEAQIRGNATTISRQNIISSKALGNATIYNNQLNSFRHANLVPNPTITIDVKALHNVVANAYTAVFNVTQIGKTSEEANTLMRERVAKVKTALLSKGIQSNDFVIDVISFVPVYETVVERKLFSKKYNEVPKGFELQQNIHIKFNKVKQFENILSACANNEIYNLVKVDYFIDNIQQIYTKLRLEILKILKEKKQFYSDLDFDLKTYTPSIADTKYCHFPREFYKSYQAFNSISLEAINKKKGITTAKKQTSYYYEPITFKEYDVVINPTIVEPVVQIGMEIKLQYTPKPIAQKTVKKQLIKNKYFIISNDGAISLKELKLEQ